MTDRVWIADQVTVLAEGFGAPLTPQRLHLYVDHLCDLEQANLAQAIGRAFRERKFFPTVAELRELADAGAAQDRDLAVEAAWRRALENLRKYGVDRLPTFRNGEMVAPPRLDEGTEYAIRAAGGRAAINDSLNAENVSAESFSKKRFIEAFGSYDEVKVSAFAQLPGDVRGMVVKLLDAPRLSADQPHSAEKSDTTSRRIKPLPLSPTDTEFEARRAQLAQQAAELKRRFAQE